jgi:hypothetical protein
MEPIMTEDRRTIGRRILGRLEKGRPVITIIIGILFLLFGSAWMLGGF